MIKAALLTPYEVFTGWDMLFHVIFKSDLYPPMGVSDMLDDAVKGNVQVWMLRSENRIIGALCTQKATVPYTGLKVLSLIHGNTDRDTHVSDEEWQGIYKMLMRYAKAEGCRRFEVYSETPRVREILTTFGFQQNGLFGKEV